jgi:hypothetical protein
MIFEGTGLADPNMLNVRIVALDPIPSPTLGSWAADGRGSSMLVDKRAAGGQDFPALAIDICHGGIGIFT